MAGTQQQSRCILEITSSRESIFVGFQLSPRPSVGLISVVLDVTAGERGGCSFENKMAAGIEVLVDAACIRYIYIPQLESVFHPEKSRELKAHLSSLALARR